MNTTERVDKVWNAIKCIDKYNVPEAVAFFEMNNYTFILKEDVKKIWKEDFKWVKEDHGTVGDYTAIRLEKFDPNDIGNYFDDLMFRGYFPYRIVVKQDYWGIEKDYVKEKI